MKISKHLDNIFFKRPLAAYLILAIALVAGVSAMSRETEKRTTANRELIEENKRQDADQCKGINDANGAVRFLLDATVARPRPTSNPLTEEDKELLTQAYEKLPETDCVTGYKKVYEPPFPASSTSTSTIP